MGAHVLGVDIDEDALEIAQDNSEELNPWEDDLCIDFVKADVMDLAGGKPRCPSDATHHSFFLHHSAVVTDEQPGILQCVFKQENGQGSGLT